MIRRGTPDQRNEAAQSLSYAGQRSAVLMGLLEDLGHAWRGLRRQPLFALAGSGLLALGLASSSTVFSFVEAVLLRPLPGVSDADRLVRIQERVANPGPGQRAFRNVTLPDMRQLAQAAPSLSGTAAMLVGGTLPFTGVDGAVRIPVTRVTSGFFAVVGTQPARGRAFTAEDELPGADPVAVLSHGAARRLLGDRAAAPGARLMINHRAHTVIGIMPPGFSFPDAPDAYLPLSSSPFTDRFHVTVGLARVKPGVSLERVRAEADAALARLAQEEPDGDHGVGARVVLWRASVTEAVRPALRMLALAALLVLLLAIANLAGLLTSRSAARARELAVRRSLGATEARIMRLLVAESLLLGLVGAVLAVLCTGLTLRTVVALSPADLPFRSNVRLNVGVLGFTAVLAVCAGLLAGLVPAWRARRSLHVRERADAAPAAPSSSAWLVVTQVAVATVMVASAGLLLRSFVTALRIDPGIRTDGVLTASVSLARSRYPQDDQQRAFFEAALDSIRALPGVMAAELSLFTPLDGAIPAEVSADAATANAQLLHINPVSAGYLHMLGVPLLDGRAPEARDDETGERIALLSRRAAARLWPDRSPVGRLLYYNKLPYRVVGVVGDVPQSGLLNDDEGVAYFSFRQFPFNAGTFVVVGRDASALPGRIRSIVQSLDPALPLDRVQTLASVMDESLAQPRFYSVTVGTFGVLALALAVAGLYAVVAVAVRRRIVELGVRSALGARPQDNLWLVFRQGLLLSASGVGAGLLLAVYATQLLRSMLFRTEPTDLLSLLLAGALMLLATLLAVLTPALRAARVDPLVALRAE
jgi:predicted permease